MSEFGEINQTSLDSSSSLFTKSQCKYNKHINIGTKHDANHTYKSIASVYDRCVSVGDDDDVAPEEENVRKGVIISIALTQEDVEASKSPEPESDVPLVDPVGKMVKNTSQFPRIRQ